MEGKSTPFGIFYYPSGFYGNLCMQSCNGFFFLNFNILFFYIFQNILERIYQEIKQVSFLKIHFILYTYIYLREFSSKEKLCIIFSKKGIGFMFLRRFPHRILKAHCGESSNRKRGLYWMSQQTLYVNVSHWDCPWNLLNAISRKLGKSPVYRTLGCNRDVT